MDIGKSAKHMGQKHPRDLRRIDPVPLRQTPAAKPHRKADKPFGFSYEEFRWWKKFTSAGASWKRRFEWFATERAASQALRAFAHKHGSQEWYRDLRAERRN